MDEPGRNHIRASSVAVTARMNLLVFALEYLKIRQFCLLICPCSSFGVELNMWFMVDFSVFIPRSRGLEQSSLLMEGMVDGVVFVEVVVPWGKTSTTKRMRWNKKYIGEVRCKRLCSVRLLQTIPVSFDGRNCDWVSLKSTLKVVEYGKLVSSHHICVWCSLNLSPDLCNGAFQY